MIEVRLTSEQWMIALAAAEGMHSQLSALVGPYADGGSPRSMAAVKVIGQLQWIQRTFRAAVQAV